MIFDMKNGFENGEFKFVVEFVEVVVSCVFVVGFIFVVLVMILDYSEVFYCMCDVDFV